MQGRLAGEWDGRALALCRTSAQEGTRARWRQYRAVWAWVEGDACRREGILRHFGDRSAPAPTGPCCDVCDPSLGARAAAAARAARTPPPGRSSRTRPAAEGELGALDEAILDVVASAEPEVGRTRAVEILRGGQLEGGQEVLLRRAAALRRVRRTSPGRRCSSASTRCSTAGHAALDRRALPEAGGGMRVGVLASGAGTNLQAILDRVHGRDGVEVVAVGTDQPGAPALERAARAGVATAMFPRAEHADRAARDARDGGLARRRAASSWSCSPATCAAHAGLPRALPRPRDQRPPGAAARVPRACARSSRRSTTA